MSINGFGYYDAMDYVSQPEDERWIIENILPKGFGFIAGLPKGSNSPHGGKSVFFRSMAHAILTKSNFLGNKIIESGNTLCINIDESIDDQVTYFKRLCSEEKVYGFKVSKSRFLAMPETLEHLHNDIKELKPILTNIDPLLRTVGGKSLNESKTTAPIMDALKRIYELTNSTIALNHHSQKSDKRNKESSSTWLNGSIDLDSAWDFCICLEWVNTQKFNKDDVRGYMHARCFTRKKPIFNLFYEAVSNSDSQILGLRSIPEDIKDSLSARLIYFYLSDNKNSSVNSISKHTGVSRPTVDKYLTKYKSLKNLLETMQHPCNLNGQKPLSVAPPISTFQNPSI